MKKSICFFGMLLASLVASAEPSSEYIQKNAIPFMDLAHLSDPVLAVVLDYKLITVGEMHGTEQSPAFVYGLAEKLSLSGKSVLVGLEIPDAYQPEIDRFMKSGDVGILKGLEFFTRKYQDGRSSQAMALLLDRLHGLKGVEVYCFDTMNSTGGQDRDEKMAQNLVRGARKFRKDVVLMLAGNVHAAVTAGMPWDPQYRPMAYNVIHQEGSPFAEKDVLAIRLRYYSGSAWVCMGKDEISCGPTAFGPQGTNYARAVEYENYFLKEESLSEGYLATFFVRSMTASSPLVQP